MNRPGDDLALRKQLLVARSSLCRLRIRHEGGALREGLSFRPLASMAASSAPARDAAFLLAMEGLGQDRTARLLAIASRALMVARFARIALALLKSPSAGPSER